MLGLFSLVMRLAKALFCQFGDQVDQVMDQVGQGQGQELDKNQIIYCMFWMNNVHFLKILLNNPKNFIKQFFELFFIPTNTSPKVKNELKDNFLGTPCMNPTIKSYIYIYVSVW